MVLCLSLHLIEPYICERLGLDFPTAVELSRRMYSAAQVSMVCDQCDAILSENTRRVFITTNF